MTVLLQVFACCQSNNHVTLLPGMESIDIHPDKAKMEEHWPQNTLIHANISLSKVLIAS